MRRLLLILESIKFEHSIFALPFAYIGMVLAARGIPTWDRVFWITLAMVGARTLAMAANRLIDAELDALNPRTANRALPRGLLSRRDMVMLGFAGLAVLVLAAWRLNPLCLQLTPVAVAVLIGYSYTKRFTWMSHAILGLADGMAPVGGWIAVTGTLDPPAILLGLAVLFWIAGFDLIYACQDVEVDRRDGLYSIPACFGIPFALRLARFCHVLTVLLLVAVGLLAGLGWPYGLGLMVVAALLVYEHSLVSPTDLSKVNLAFFTMNGYISIIAFLATALALWLS